MTNKTDAVKFNRYIITYNGYMFDVVEVVGDRYIVKDRFLMLITATQYLKSLMFDDTANELKSKWHDALIELRNYLYITEINMIDEEIYEKLADDVEVAYMHYIDHASTY